MTTSAVNINIVDRRPARVCSTPNDVTVPMTCTISGQHSYRFEKKLRPASSTVGISTDGWRACKSWNHSGHTWSYDGGSVRVVTKQTGYNRVTEYPDGTYWGSFTPPTASLFPNGLVNRTEQDALLKLKDQDFNLGQFAAEWKQTARLLASTALTIARQVRNFKKKFKKEWKQVKRWQGQGRCKRENWHKIPRKWLELQYGWIPLMSDVYGAAAHLRKDRIPNVHVKSHKRDTTSTSYRVSGISNPGANYCTLEYDTNHDCWVSLWYELKSPALAEFSSLGLINPVEILWEVTPYSFVIDWFLPVGNWLSSLTADVGFTFKGGSLSKLSKVKGIRISGGVMQVGTTTVSGPFPRAVGDSFQFTRTCYNSTPVPGLYLKNPLSAKHIANALALLALAFGRR